MKDTLQTAALKLRIDQLQEQVKALKDSQALDQMKYRATEHQEVVNQVNEFYNSSWSNLLWLIGFLGLVVPVVMQLISSWTQRKSLKELTDTISNQLTETFDSKIQLLKDKNDQDISKLNTLFKDRADELEQIAHKKSRMNIGLSFLMKGLNDAQNGLFALGIYHIFYAILMYIEADDAGEIQAALKNIDLIIIDSPDPNNLIEANKKLEANDYKMSISDIIVKLKSVNNNSLYKKELERLEDKLKMFEIL